jgi:capsular polysaccharide biosynthesis protein
MDPSVLDRAVGDAKVMHDQMLYLLEMAKRRNVMINFVPLDSSAGAGFLSGFVIANFDGGSDVAYVDNQLNGEVVENIEDVARLRNMFETFRTAAMTSEHSIRLIQKAVERWMP